MKETIEFIKKLWDNKKTRSLAILLIYAIFFVFVFLFIGSFDKKPIVKTEPLEKLQSMYVSKLEVTGQHNFKIENNLITYNDVIYTLEEKPIELSIYDTSIYTPYNIYNLIKSAILESQNYVNNNKTYLISAQEFESIIYGNAIDTNANIRITLNEDNISVITIDLKEYYGYEIKMEVRS